MQPLSKEEKVKLLIKLKSQRKVRNLNFKPIGKKEILLGKDSTNDD